MDMHPLSRPGGCNLAVKLKAGYDTHKLVLDMLYSVLYRSNYDSERLDGVVPAG